MKQTAVEWLVSNIDWMLLKNSKLQYKMIIKQAKEMEKEQIVNAVENTIKSIELTKDKTGFFAMGGEGYYNETFKSEQDEQNK